jgi:protoporphyrinogen oxidase
MSDDIRSVPYLVIGAGLSGLAAGAVFKDEAVVLERDAAPGGLVRGFRMDDYWFDLVPHMLYFPDKATEDFVRPIAGEVLKPAVPDGYVESLKGTTRYPIQGNLRGLGTEVAIECLRDLAKVTFGPERAPPRNLGEALSNSFGDALCDIFMHPYNRKVWARDLKDVPPSLMWTIMRPSYEAVLRGAMLDESFRTYNSSGWYTRPGPGAPVMTMQLLSDALASAAGNVLLEREVVSVDIETRIVECRAGGKRERYRYERDLLVTMPMPGFAAICPQVPEVVRQKTAALDCMAVWMVGLCITGPRPKNRGKWRYYADESLVFTRLIHMHEYDADTCPEDGWSIMAEILERSDAPPRDVEALIARVEADVRRSGGLGEGCEIVARKAWRCDPGYVVESEDAARVTKEFAAALTPQNVHLLGRYGLWQYSSMGQVLRDGMVLARTLQAHEGRVGEASVVAAA